MFSLYIEFISDMVYEKHPVGYFVYGYLVTLLLFVEEIILFILSLEGSLGTFVKQPDGPK